MDIVSRLKFFLENKHISNSVFADKCKIARPTLSQLLSGRNKKVSDEIISKIHESYPSLSILWLLFGEGNMELYPADSIPLENSISDISDENISNSENSSAANTTNLSPVINFDFENFESEHGIMQNADADSMDPKAVRVLANSGKGVDLSNSADLKAVSSSNSGKKIVNIMVFYNDNSFDSFLPASK